MILLVVLYFYFLSPTTTTLLVWSCLLFGSKGAAADWIAQRQDDYSVSVLHARMRMMDYAPIHIVSVQHD